MPILAIIEKHGTGYKSIKQNIINYYQYRFMSAVAANFLR